MWASTCDIYGVCIKSLTFTLAPGHTPATVAYREVPTVLLSFVLLSLPHIFIAH